MLPETFSNMQLSVLKVEDQLVSILVILLVWKPLYPICESSVCYLSSVGFRLINKGVYITLIFSRKLLPYLVILCDFSGAQDGERNEEKALERRGETQNL